MNEAINLKLKDINTQRMVMLIHGKGSKERLVVLSEKLLAVLKEYYLKCNIKPDNYLFPSSIDPDKPFSKRHVEYFISEKAKQAGIKTSVTPHVLRHCFASHMLEDGYDIKKIQTLMGHSSLSTTAIYLHVAKNYLNSTISPLDKLEGIQIEKTSYQKYFDI